MLGNTFSIDCAFCHSLTKKHLTDPHTTSVRAVTKKQMKAASRVEAAFLSVCKQNKMYIFTRFIVYIHKMLIYSQKYAKVCKKDLTNADYNSMIANAPYKLRKRRVYL